MKRYLVLYRSPRNGASCGVGQSCELHDQEIIFGKPKGYSFFLARFIQHYLVFTDSLAETGLRLVKSNAA